MAYEVRGPTKIAVSGVDVTLLKPSELKANVFNSELGNLVHEILLFEWDLAYDDVAERMLIHLEDSLIVFGKA